MLKILRISQQITRILLYISYEEVWTVRCGLWGGVDCEEVWTMKRCGLWGGVDCEEVWTVRKMYSEYTHRGSLGVRLSLAISTLLLSWPNGSAEIPSYTIFINQHHHPYKHCWLLLLLLLLSSCCCCSCCYYYYYYYYLLLLLSVIIMVDAIVASVLLI